MKKILTFFIAGAAIAALGTALIACNTPKEPGALEQGEDVPFTEYSLGKGILGEETSAHWVNLNGKNETNIIVINSDEELRVYIDGNLPYVDFTEKTILLAYGVTPRGFQKAEVENFSNMSNNRYRLNVTAFLYETAIRDRWLVAILTDKIENGSEIELNVKFPDTWPE